jgi:alkylation response protein AidB-like acyl-CoA dehydrogenase
MTHAAVQAIEALQPLIEAEAAATEAGSTLSAPLVDAFADKGLFHLMVPASLGGAEADTDTILDVLAGASFADGSVGWSLMADINSTAYVAYIDPAAAQQIVADSRGCAAGMFGPMGGLAHKLEDGYQVSGNYQFGSGCGHASFIGCGTLEMHNGEMAPAYDSGMPVARCFFLPSDQVEIKGNWDVVGLRGTGSFDYEVPEQQVAESWSFELFDAKVQSGGALSALGPVVQAALCHAGWGLGMGRKALAEIKAVVNAGRARMGSNPLGEQQVFQREFSRLSLALDAADLLTRDIFRTAMAEADSTKSLSEATAIRCRSAASFITQAAEQCMTFAYQQAGSGVMRNPSALQKAQRDMMVGARHLFVDERNYEDLARLLLAQES